MTTTICNACGRDAGGADLLHLNYRWLHPACALEEGYSPAMIAAANGTQADAGPGSENDPQSDSPAVGAIRRALLEEPASLRDALLEERPALDPMPGTNGLIHRGEGHVMFSSRGAGKSLVALILGLSAAARGERVLYLDRENGDAVTASRVRDIVEANPAWAGLVESGQLVGSHWPRLDRSWKGQDVGGALADFSLLIGDSSRELINQLEGDPNADESIAELVSLIVTPLRERGGAVLLLDNTGHQNPERPKGSGSKLDAVPTAYKLTARTPFTPEQTGEVVVTCVRSRHGTLERSWVARVGGGIYELPGEGDPAAIARGAQLRDEVRRVATRLLTEHDRMGRNTLTKALRSAGVAGRDAALREALSDLASDPASGIAHDAALGYSLSGGGVGP